MCLFGQGLLLLVIAQWWAVSGWGHLAVGTAPFVPEMAAVEVVFQLVPKVAGL